MNEKAVERVTIKPIQFRTFEVVIEGTSPLVQARFSLKAINAIRATQEAGQAARAKKKREPRDFDADFEGAKHFSTDGWVGVPASAFRNAAIDVCRMTGFKMTFARMSLFVEADGSDVVDGQPLVRILSDEEPEKLQLAVRNANGNVDLRVRPMWRSWRINLRVRYDSDQFTASDVANLLERAGSQVGIGEGRPFSKSSNGMGYGTFRLVRDAAEQPRPTRGRRVS